MSNNQNQGGMGKSIMKLIIRNRIIILLILTVITGLLFYNAYTNLNNKYEVNEDKQAFLNELSGQGNIKAKEGVKTIAVASTTVSDAVRQSEINSLTNNQAVASVEDLKVLQENDYYIIELLDTEETEENIIVNIKYTVNDINTEYGNDMVFLSSGQTKLATASGMLPLADIQGVGLIDFEKFMMTNSDKEFDDVLGVLSSIQSDKRIPPTFFMEGKVIFNKPAGFDSNKGAKLVLISMPLSVCDGLNYQWSMSKYSKFKDYIFKKPYNDHYDHWIFEDTLDIKF